MKIVIAIVLFLSLAIVSCTKMAESNSEGKTMGTISEQTVNKVVQTLTKKYGDAQKFRIERGVKQAASFWTEEDGTDEDFEKFCSEKFICDEKELDLVFEKLQTNFEILVGNLHKITMGLRMPIDVSTYASHPIDEIFGSYAPYAHLNDDFFKNKVAFTILLNFPHYSLEEKSKLGVNWTRKQWAYARVGDMYSSRIPAELQQKATEVLSNADLYISNYNIYVGFLKDNNGNTLFSKDKKLISHWNLRDEIKSQYSNPEGLERQKIIYEVMKRIITQEIPKDVINKNDVYWNPYSNKVFKDNKEIEVKSEPNTRYQFILDNFKANLAIDKYCPLYPTLIQRKFEEEMELSQKFVEDLFIKFITSPQAKDVAKLIETRLGRKLEPWDIWYDGFKARSSMPEDKLSEMTKAKYPTKDAFAADLPNILKKLGFSAEKASQICSKIEVDPSRGAGHAAGAEMKSDNSRLRTRVGKDGMDYKGYNIAVHEFGHNVEQTVTLQDMDYYFLKGVPSTAFTEAWSFIFQKRDLALLGIKEENSNKEYLLTLDNFWAGYEIMGVSIVDMRVWNWLYKNPEATAEELKKATIKIALEVWNSYYAPVMGMKDQPILAIYSHMIDNPLYLSAYPIGHLIEFQIDSYMKGKNIGDEMLRILTSGRILPQFWMKNAVGRELSIEPTLEATAEALKIIKN